MRQLALSFLAAITLGSSVFAQNSSDEPLAQPLTMQFTDADVSQVLKAIGLKTGSRIVYAGRDKTSITVDSVVSSTEEAVRTVVSIAHLVYRKFGSTYVVAPVGDLKQASEPFGQRETFTLTPATAVNAGSLIEQALPYATVRTVGDRVIVVGNDEDLKDARSLVESVQKEQADHERITETVSLRQLSLTNATQVVQDLYKDLQMRATTKSDVEVGGVFALTGEASQVRAGIAMLQRLDASVTNDSNRVVYRVYHLRYTSAYVIRQLLKGASTATTGSASGGAGSSGGGLLGGGASAGSGTGATTGPLVPGVDCYIGLEAYSPPRAQFNPISGALGSQTGGSTSGSSSSSSSGSVSGSSAGPLAADHSIQIGDRAMSVILRGPEASVDAAEKIIRSLDVKPRQVIIDVAAVETTPTFTSNLGLSWNLQNTATVTEQTYGASGVGVGTFKRTTPLTFTALMNAAITRGEGKLLAHPRVQVTENDDADVFIGNIIYVQQSTASIAGTTNSLTAIQVGVIMLIRARISPDGNILMHLDPAVSSISSISTAGIPQISTREAETNVIVKDGETIVIGGLIREDDTKTVTEVPFLSKLPIVGELFRSTNVSKTKDNLIITITPHLVKDEEAGQ